MDNEKFNKLLNEKYYLLNDIVKKFNYSEELHIMLTLIYLTFYLDFGHACDFPIYDLFNKVRIFYDVGTVNDVSIKNGFGPMPSGSAAVTIFIPNLKVFKDASLKQNPQKIILGTHVDEYLATPLLKLEMLAHEIRHALMGYYKTNILLDDHTYYMRSGLQETFYYRDDSIEENFTSSRLGMTLDEITNTYITELLVNRIMSFKKYTITNPNIRKYLDTLKVSQTDGRYRSIGYNTEVRLLYPILLQESFITIVNNHQFTGEIERIKEFIGTYTDKVDYNELCELLDSIYTNNSLYPSEVEKKNLEFIQSHIREIKRAKEIVLDIDTNIKKLTRK